MTIPRGLIRHTTFTTKYTFWCHDRASNAVFDMRIQDAFAETSACRDEVVKLGSTRYEYGPVQLAGTPAHDFNLSSADRERREKLCGYPATPPAPVAPTADSDMCCLPWCVKAASKHTSERTERCLDYAVKKEIIEKRLSIFSSVVKVSSEIAWATKKTAEELETLERQWRSLDPDRVGRVS